MDAREILQRVVAPGAYYAVMYKHPDAAKPGHRFFPQTQEGLTEAVAFIHETAATSDVWYALAGFKVKRRKQENAEALRCFWYDADIRRPGDGKADDAVWANLVELVQWLAQVKAELPTPNLWISSGYGVHLYWVLDEAIPADEWMGYAKSFRDRLKMLGARGDISISANSACILRPPETFNYKVPEAPVPTKDLTPNKDRYKFSAHYVTKDFLARLTPGSNPLGPKPARPVNQESLAAAKANLSKPEPADFRLIATKCAQVKKSLDEGGEHDDRELWHRLVNLAFFCDDRQAAHDIGHKWQGRKGSYSEEDTNAKFDQTAREHAEKGNFGAPNCESLDRARPGVCEHCQYWKKINSPFSLGYELPGGYQQSPEGVWTKDADGQWERIVPGNVSSERLLYLGSGTGFQLLFDYELMGEVYHVQALESEISPTAERAHSFWAKKDITIDPKNAGKFSRFIVAWITKLREARMFTKAPPSFGWVANKEGSYDGVAIAGIYYRTDGGEGLAQMGDPKIHENYQPSGDIKLWRKACEYVIADRPELHTIVAASFAAPLMQLIGEPGILSVWSQQSGVRKTSAFRVASAVWCHPVKGMPALRDTPYSVQHSLAETKITPVFWDEIHADNKEQKAAVVDMLFNVTQGRGRGRLSQKIEMREVGDWCTLLMPSGNKPLAEMVELSRPDTDAGAVRVFEYSIERVDSKSDPKAMSIVQLAQHNYGWAGREYIRWVVCNLDKVQELIAALEDNLHRDIDLKSEERFHVATVVGVVAGAYIANKIGLVKLDWKGVYEFLKSKMHDIRGKREEDAPTDPKERLLRYFDQFVAEHVNNLLVTQNFSKQGRRPGAVAGNFLTVIGDKEPRYKERALIHIGLDEREMRFDKKALKVWCDRNGISYTNLLDEMTKQWNVAKATRGFFAANTPHMSGSRVEYYRISLTLPELAHHLEHGTPAPSNVVPFPAAE
jgi:Domain of unknown function (DUF927)